MTNEKEIYDIVVLGSGAGGIFSAARLAHAGYRTLVLEKSDRLGGRFSSIDVEGYRISTGAIAIECGGSAVEDTFNEVNAAFHLKQPTPGIVFKIGAFDIPSGNRFMGQILRKVSKNTDKLIRNFYNAKGGDLNGNSGMSVKEWVNRQTKNKTIHGVFQGLSASIFCANADEIPVNVFFQFFRETGGYKKFGFAPNGNIKLVEALAEVVEQRGGRVLKGAEATRISVENGKAKAVEVKQRRDNKSEKKRFSAKIVVSDVGPLKTAELIGSHILGEDYTASVRKALRPTSMFSIAVTAEKALSSYPGFYTFSDGGRICTVANMTAKCPELAPEGRNLYEVYAVPRPSIGVFDREKEESLIMQEFYKKLRCKNDEVTIINTCWHAGEDSPAMRSLPGFDLPPDTPVKNVFNVGDAIKPAGWGGTTACAVMAKLLTQRIIDEFSLASITF